MRPLFVVATTARGIVNMFPQSSFTEAWNLKDFLEETGEYATVALYELEKADGPVKQWAALHESAK